MGNKLTCSCAPLIRKAYRHDEAPWQRAGRGRDGHLLRLWAEVFHVTAGEPPRWQQVSESLVPVNIQAVEDGVFHITAYNSQVDKILDVRLVQPGTRMGQASECFVYWKDPANGETWGLNFSNPLDAKQFRECCAGRGGSKGKRKPQSTPSSPSRPTREPQCTCVRPQQATRLRYSGSVSTLPRQRPADAVSVKSSSPGLENIPPCPRPPVQQHQLQQQQLQQQLRQQLASQQQKEESQQSFRPPTQDGNRRGRRLCLENLRSDNLVYDNYCYATTPSSSNNSEEPYLSDDEGSTPTKKLLQEYELHLRNALARGLDAESYSLHTFETLLSHSMENVVALMRQAHPHMKGLEAFESRRFSTPEAAKASTLPTSCTSARQLGLTSDGRGGVRVVGRPPSLGQLDNTVYLTSSEMSDDERLSLTTAVSDEEDGDARNCPYRSRSGAAAASFNCTGAVRKAGFLSVKKWLLRRHQQVELAHKRGWKGYWATLKGTTLLFYPCENGRAIDSSPRHLIIVDGAIMQAVPEHPKRDFVFCLSTAFGDAYLFQAPCQVELENWITSIHAACAAAFARHRGKTGTLHLLQEEICKLEKNIESDFKMKHMAELQLTVVADNGSKTTLLEQIKQWEENLERVHCEQFRLRCYMASLQNSELPNPKNLLGHVSKPTKATLNKLGVFTVSSFHAYICARSPTLLTNLLSGRGSTKKRFRTLSRSNSAKQSLYSNSQESGKLCKVLLPDHQSMVAEIPERGTTVEDLVWQWCCKTQLLPNDHFLRLHTSKGVVVPQRHERLEQFEEVERMEICPKVLYQVELCRQSLDQLFGFSVEAELVESGERHDELAVFVSKVEEGSLAHRQGLERGDEIMVINGAIVTDLDMMYIEGVLQEENSLCMMMRTCRLEPPDLLQAMKKSTDDYIESLVVCPPPPSDHVITEEMIDKLIVPSPMFEPSPSTSGRPSPTPALAAEQIDNLLKSAEQLTQYCRMPGRRASLTESTAGSSVTMRQLTDAEHLRKVIMELVDTERTYVKDMEELLLWYSQAPPSSKHLNSLLDRYLEPLNKESFLAHAEVRNLFGYIREIVAFQHIFLQSLEGAVRSEANFARLNQISQFKKVLIALSKAFLDSADKFKLYSSFCASHSKAQKVLNPGEGNAALMEFLQARNPQGQHSFSLESYLIKPIQRILKYPLLLQELKNRATPGSEEHRHLTEAHLGMNRVAEHINEMQRIHDEYGAIFEHLYRQHIKSSRQAMQMVDLSPGELLYYGGVEWLNISDFLGKIKKGLELHAMCFVFNTAVVFLCKERIRHKKKLMGNSSKGAEVEIIRYQVLIPVTEVQVRTGMTRDSDHHFLWELIHLKTQIQRRTEKVYQLSNSTNEFRNAFLRTIRKIIRESVKNMTVPQRRPTKKETPRPQSCRKKGGQQRHSTSGGETYDNVLPTRSKTVDNKISEEPSNLCSTKSLSACSNVTDQDDITWPPTTDKSATLPHRKGKVVTYEDYKGFVTAAKKDSTGLNC